MNFGKVWYELFSVLFILEFVSNINVLRLNSESHARRQMEASVSSLRLQLQEQVNQTAVLLHEVEVMKSSGSRGGVMKRKRM